MAEIVVVGAGLGGLQAAMLLAGDGHRVTVVERDPAPVPDTAAAAVDGWARRGVNQFVYPHFLLARWRELAEVELPAAVDELEAAGALRFNVFAEHPARQGDLRPGDERFEVLTARRPVVEMAGARAAAATPGVEIRRGVAVRGLITDGGTAGAPRVAGLATDGGEVRADLVVDCGGRRSALPGWLAAAGAGPVAEEREDSGFVYYGRHFADPDGGLPPGHGELLTHHDSLSLLTLPADHGTWAVVLVAAAEDRALRALTDAAIWDRAAALYPRLAPWLEGKPLEDPRAIAAIEDRHRRLVVHGVPAATGVVAVGDAWACTNPSLGRGISIGLEHAACLRDVARQVAPARHEEFALAFAAATDERLEPRYRRTLDIDRRRLAELRADAAGEAYDPGDPGWAIGKAMAVAALHDDEVLRALVSIAELLSTAEQALAPPGILDTVIERGAGAPRYPAGNPARTDLVAALAAAA